MTDPTPSITTPTVIRALYDLGFDRRDERVTRERVAKYLEADEAVVGVILADLGRARLVSKRRRGGEQVYEPWSGQE